MTIQFVDLEGYTNHYPTTEAQQDEVVSSSTNTPAINYTSVTGQLDPDDPSAALVENVGDLNLAKDTAGLLYQSGYVGPQRAPYGISPFMVAAFAQGFCSASDFKKTGDFIMRMTRVWPGTGLASGPFYTFIPSEPEVQSVRYRGIKCNVFEYFDNLFGSFQWELHFGSFLPGYVDHMFIDSQRVMYLKYSRCAPIRNWVFKPGDWFSEGKVGHDYPAIFWWEIILKGGQTRYTDYLLHHEEKVRTDLWPPDHEVLPKGDQFIIYAKPYPYHSLTKFRVYDDFYDYTHTITSPLVQNQVGWPPEGHPLYGTGIESDVYVEAVSEYSSKTQIKMGDDATIQCSTNECCAPEWSITDTDLPDASWASIDANGLITIHIPWDTQSADVGDVFYIDVTVKGPYQEVTRTVYVELLEPDYFGTTWTGLGAGLGSTAISCFEGTDYLFWGTTGGKIFYSPKTDPDSFTEIPISGGTGRAITGIAAIDDTTVIATSAEGGADSIRVLYGSRGGVSSVLTIGSWKMYGVPTGQALVLLSPSSILLLGSNAGTGAPSIKIVDGLGATPSVIKTTEYSGSPGYRGNWTGSDDNLAWSTLTMLVNNVMRVFYCNDASVDASITLDAATYPVTATATYPFQGKANDGTRVCLLNTSSNAYTSSDGGVTWVSTGFTPGAAPAGAVQPLSRSGYQTLVFASNGKIYRSTDGGDTVSEKLSVSTAGIFTNNFLVLSDRRIIPLGLYSGTSHYAYISEA